MAAFHREIAKYFLAHSQKVAQSNKSLVKAAHVPTIKHSNILVSALKEKMFPLWFKYFRGPLDRWNHAAMSKYLREHGLMYDDMYSDKEPVIERALEMLSEDLATHRYRRIMRATHLNHIRLYLPLKEQNYDPFIPYLAPFVEEAKFQLQEEEELLGFHMWDRRLYSGGCTGFGDLEAGCHFLTSFPNMYGAGGGVHGKAHLSTSRYR